MEKNSSLLQLGAIERYEQLISNMDLWYLNVYMNGVVCGIVAILGTFTNSVNMVIFFQLGLKDSMSVCLFSLALTDFLLSFVVLTSRVFPFWSAFFKSRVLNPMDIWYVGFDWVADSLFLCSGWITTFLALERSVCVTLPFKVKQMFTKRRSAVTVATIYLVSAAIYVPVYATHALTWMEENDQNAVNATSSGGVVRRRLVLTFSDNRHHIEFYVDVLSGNLLPLASLILMLGSVAWMVRGLSRSSKIRQAMTTSCGEGNDKADDSGGAKQEYKLTYKTRRLVKVVIILAVTFTLCTIPRTFAMHMYLFNAQVKQHGKESNMYTFQWHFTSLATVVNAFVNIFVYLTINTSYRAKFEDLFRCGASLKKTDVAKSGDHRRQKHSSYCFKMA